MVERMGTNGMMKRIEQIYIVAPAHVYTGGPTALFQLCHYLNNCFNAKAKIAFVNIRSLYEDPVHPNYKRFKCEWLPLQRVRDDSKNLIIFPETLTDLVHRFKLSRKAIYWLAVDNFFFSSHFSSRHFSKESPKFLFNLLLFCAKYRSIPSRYVANDIKQYIVYREIANAVKNVELRDFLSMIDLHIAQSEYAKNFLIKLGLDEEKIIKLREPLEEEFLNTYVNFDTKEDVITFNARKAFSIVYKILNKVKSQVKSARIIPLINVGKERMIKILSKSKVFIDIGMHPGRDRPPREAAILGNIVIVNRRGGCYNFQDCPIPDKYAFRCRDVICRDLNINGVVDLIIDCLKNYHQHTMNFQDFREYIRNEVNLYLNDLENLLAIIDQI